MMIGLYLLLNFAVLWIVARAAAAGGWRLMVMLFGLGFIVGSANDLIEAVAFGVLSPRQVMAAALPPAIVFAILSPGAVFLSGRWRTGDVPARQTDGFTPLT